MTELLNEYREWRKEQDLPWNPNFVLKVFDGLADLEHRYWRAEQKAIAVEQGLATKKVMEKKALPPARPRRKPQRTVTTLKNGDLKVKPDGYVTGDDLKAFMEFIKAEIGDIQEATQAALDKRLVWRGTWRAGESYAANDICQDKGTIWVCNAAKSEARPGSGSGRRMLVKTQERVAK